jgi:hypothetical protein
MKLSIYNIINKFLPYFTIITTTNLQIFIIIMMFFCRMFLPSFTIISLFCLYHTSIAPLLHFTIIE